MNSLSTLGALKLIYNGEYNEYKGNIIVKINMNKIEVINNLNLEDYVKGVIKGEAGYKYNKKYYKVQAVISRTYGIKNLSKHLHEGFNLCNTTHCQVYAGTNTLALIDSAVEETNGIVLKNNENEYMNTLFHSSCGGQTIGAEQVWSNSVVGLYSVIDTFCIKNDIVKWNKIIPKQDFISFLSIKLNKPSSFFENKDLNFNQSKRKTYYEFNSYKIKLTELRQYFNLKSTNFTIYEIDNKLVFNGKGYGHGVGLCQIGAIEMSKIDFVDYVDILYYYYTDSKLVNINKEGFFSDF